MNQWLTRSLLFQNNEQIQKMKYYRQFYLVLIKESDV